MTAGVALEMPGDPVRYEKKAKNYRGLIEMVCILLWYSGQYRLAI